MHLVIRHMILLSTYFLPGSWHHLFSAWGESTSTNLAVSDPTRSRLSSGRQSWASATTCWSWAPLLPSLGYQQEFLEVTSVWLSPHLLEDIVAILLEENGIFTSNVDACHLKQVVAVCCIASDDKCTHWSCTFRAWFVFRPLFGTCPLLSTFFFCRLQS